MKCYYCHQKVTRQEAVRAFRSFPLDISEPRAHRSCKNEHYERKDEDNLRRQNAAADDAKERWCPFPADFDCRCIATACMAWTGLRCRRLEKEQSDDV